MGRDYSWDRRTALARLAGQIELDSAFTIHDREDSADLINLMRHELGFSKTENRFPTKGTCLAIYSRCVNAELPIEDVLRASFPWCATWSAELKQLFIVYVEAKQRQNVLDYDDLLLHWAQMVSDPTLAGEVGGRFDHVLVDARALGRQDFGQAAPVECDETGSRRPFAVAAIPFRVRKIVVDN